ncbi:hypothetical protein Ciccas_005048 [Cichlidogyrus casuarinus]|uniref:FERM domain-containing protein n=1 Tax=Cichlidogyrus casuarinus TaxID=1844966 RepID=A0ABD2Q9R3_9PLAT
MDQLKANRSVSFRFKHYPANPLTELGSAKSEYVAFCLKRDLQSGRLITPPSSPISLQELAALVAQVHLGDHSENVSDESQSYLEDFRILHNQNANVEKKIIEEHKNLE